MARKPRYRKRYNRDKAGRRIYRVKPEKGGVTYRAFWAKIDGAVLDAFRCHPEYLAPGIALGTVRRSIAKRVLGAIQSFASEIPATNRYSFD